MVSTTQKIVGVLVLLIFIAVIIYIIWRVVSDFRNISANEPWIVKETRQARSASITPGSVIRPSSDGRFGMEFTYALWIFITDYTYKDDEFKHIFHKGNQSSDPLQAPGVWLYPKENKLAINMNTFNVVKDSCDVNNIPVGKWFHLTVMLIGGHMDVYINGRLRKRCKLNGVPKQNVGDLYMTQWGGFDGFISRFRYYNYAVPYYMIEQMISQGPSNAPCEDTSKNVPPYLADDYWFNNTFPDAQKFPVQ